MEPMEPREGSTEEFEELPVPTPAAKKASRWLPVLDKIKSGKVIFIPYSSQKEMKGIRIGLARMAAGEPYKMKLEFRLRQGEHDTGELGVREHPTLPYTPSVKTVAGGEPGERRPVGRPRKQSQQ